MTRMADLLAKGLISAGDKIIWEQKNLGKKHIATITSGGKIKTADGKEHSTPSGAGKSLNNGKSIDGWLVWKTEKNGEPLDELRKRLS